MKDGGGDMSGGMKPPKASGLTTRTPEPPHARANRAAKRARLVLAELLMLTGAWIDPTREASMREVRKALEGRKRL